jgi:glycosyltransferase involved in cell wall biosynthesis
MNAFASRFHRDGHEVHHVVTYGNLMSRWTTYATPEDEISTKAFKFSRELADKIKPDVILILQDIWFLKLYKFKQPTYAYVCIDGENIKKSFAKPFENDIKPIFYTKFGYDQCAAAGYSGKRRIVPHGVDSVFSPMSKKEIRRTFGLSEDCIVIGNVNMNQVRKRLDLFIAYTAEIIRKHHDKDIRVLLHYPNSDMSMGWDIQQLCNYYGIADRMITTGIEGKHVVDESMRKLYGLLDIQVSTSCAEGWGLTTLEGMACGIPQVVPDFSGITEWTKNVAMKVSVSSEPYFLTGGINTQGRVVVKESFVDAVSALLDPRVRREYSVKSMLHAIRYSWENSYKKIVTIINH